MVWENIGKPGHFGKKRDEIVGNYNRLYGPDNWRIGWVWNDRVLDFPSACLVYEDGYYSDSFSREELWERLASEASDVYDHHPSDVESGLNYTIQNGKATHLQDISIRRVMLRRGLSFKGRELIQVRSHNTFWGNNLSPGKIPFQLPELLVTPRLSGWWDKDSVEDFWQSNKVLQLNR